MYRWFIVLTVLGVLAICADSALALSDPTRPEAYVERPSVQKESRSSAPLNLQAILFSGERQVAIINGKCCRVGDKVGPLRVERITEKTVYLRSAGSVRDLKLNRSSLKSTPDMSGY